MQVFLKRVVFRMLRPNTAFVPQYHENIFAVVANSVDSAEDLFAGKIHECVDKNYRVVQNEPAFPVAEPIGSIPVEVFHRSRVSSLSPAAYRGQFESDLRPKSCEVNGWEHAWYNVGGGYSGCYNCRARRKGKQWN